MGFLSCSLVTLEWLIASIEQKQPANERPYLFKLSTNTKPTPEQDLPTVASPASKKNIMSMNKSMNSSIRKTLVPRRLEMDPTAKPVPDEDGNEETNLLQQYLVPPSEPSSKQLSPIQMPAPSAPGPSKIVGNSSLSNFTDSRSDGESNADNMDLLKGLTFHLHGFSEESAEELEVDINTAGGTVVPKTYKGVIDYLMVPTDVMQIEVKLRAKHTVNENWIVSAYWNYIFFKRWSNDTFGMWLHRPIAAGTLGSSTGWCLALTNVVFASTSVFYCWDLAWPLTRGFLSTSGLCWASPPALVWLWRCAVWITIILHTTVRLIVIPIHELRRAER